MRANQLDREEDADAEGEFESDAERRGAVFYLDKEMATYLEQEHDYTFYTRRRSVEKRRRARRAVRTKVYGL